MSLQKKLITINLLNETKGQELTVLNQLPAFREQAVSEQDFAMVAESFWIEHLAHQHLVMNGQDPEGSHQKEMLATAQMAYDVVVNHNLDNLFGTSHRFLGRAYTFQNQHEQALIEYQSALKILTAQNDPRALEVSGFICESFIRTGQIKTGLNQAFQTYDSYDTNPLATTLKKVDEYKFNVWRTGIFPRLVFALEELKVDYDKAKVKSYLEKSQKILTDQNKYAYRFSEIKKILNILGSFLISLVHFQPLNHFKNF